VLGVTGVVSPYPGEPVCGTRGSVMMYSVRGRLLTVDAG
jgi:hypothetical protein